jgi:RNA polymerase-binding transcription factor DksA
LLVVQQQLLQRIFDTEDTMLAMDAERDIERTDRVQEKEAPLSWCRTEAEQAARNPSANAVAGAAEVALTALDEQGRREMAAIKEALARIDAGTYGICDTCDETISAARLTAVPMARRCVACQERFEHRTIPA